MSSLLVALLSLDSCRPRRRDEGERPPFGFNSFKRERNPERESCGPPFIAPAFPVSSRDGDLDGDDELLLLFSSPAGYLPPVLFLGCAPATLPRVVFASSLSSPVAPSRCRAELISMGLSPRSSSSSFFARRVDASPPKSSSPLASVCARVPGVLRATSA